MRKYLESILKTRQVELHLEHWEHQTELQGRDGQLNKTYHFCILDKISSFEMPHTQIDILVD